MSRRPALKTLKESIGERFTATNELSFIQRAEFPWSAKFQ